MIVRLETTGRVAQVGMVIFYHSADRLVGDVLFSREVVEEFFGFMLIGHMLAPPLMNKVH